MMREKITDPWREVSWEEAIGRVASEFKRIQAKHGKDCDRRASPRRAAPTKRPIWCRSWRAPAFGNNNTDTCARVCHSPTGYGLSTTFGTSAGTQDFDSVEQADVIMVIGANPTDGHPVFASRMKKRLRQGAKLIVIDPRRIDLVRMPHVEAQLSSAAAARHQRRGADRAGACDRHRGAGRRGVRARALRPRGVRRLGGVRRRTAQQPRGGGARSPACRPQTIRGAARLYATGGNGAIYYGLGVTEHSQGTHRGDGASPTWRWRPAISAAAASA